MTRLLNLVLMKNYETGRLTAVFCYPVLELKSRKNLPEELKCKKWRTSEKCLVGKSGYLLKNCLFNYCN